MAKVDRQTDELQMPEMVNARFSDMYKTGKCPILRYIENGQMSLRVFISRL